MGRILVWFPHGFHAPRMGSQVRALEVVRALGASGHEIHVASAWNPPASGIGWPAASIEGVKALGVRDVHIFRSPIDDLIVWAIRKVVRRGKLRPMGSWGFTPPFQIRWFARLVKRLSPDLLFMNYSVSDPMVQAAGFDRRKCVLETHDLVLLNKRLQAQLNPRLPAVSYGPENVDPEIIDLDWYRKRADADEDGEAALCARYGLCLSISSREAARIRALGGNVTHLSMSMAAGREGNTWNGGAILAAGMNSFNIQGYLWFTSKVLPALLAQEANFRLDHTGALSSRVAPLAGVERHGVVADLGAIYLKSKFAICPVFGGTGQQIKIVEAMAWGLPVVALAEPAQESPLIHGYNGLICRDEGEFIEGCLRLWRDPELCQRMGMAARETVKRELSPEGYAAKIRSDLQVNFPWL